MFINVVLEDIERFSTKMASKVRGPVVDPYFERNDRWVITLPIYNKGN